MTSQHPPVWPDYDDELLLRAALLDGENAISAWRKWHAGACYDPIDYTQQRVLPLLYNNLQRLGIEDPVMDRYRRELRYFWAINQQLYRFAARNIRALEQQNIPTIVLKGIPLSHCYYAHPGLRPMSDVDILVHREDAEAATRYFLDQGWVCTDSFIDSFDNLKSLIPIRHGINLRGPDDEKEIDLHWAIFPTNFRRLETIWEAAVTFELAGCTMTTLSPTDQLLHACSQGAGWNIVRPIRWIPDANAILSTDTVDWDGFVEQAGRFDLALPAADGLVVLRDLLGREIPHRVIERLRTLPTSFPAWMDYRLGARRPIPLIGRPLHRYFRYLRVGRSLGLGFGEYMKSLWGVESLVEILTKGIRRVWADAFGKKA